MVLHSLWHIRSNLRDHVLPSTQERFMPFFAERGYHSYALSFRGQGGSTVQPGAKAGGLASNAADVAEFVATLPALPVAVSHSFGGLVLQK